MSPISLVTAYAGCVLLVFCFFFSSMLSSVHLLMRRHAELLSYEKSVNPANNKLRQMPQVQRFGESQRTSSVKMKGFETNRPKAFNCLGVNAYPMIWQTTYLVLLLLLAV